MYVFLCVKNNAHKIVGRRGKPMARKRTAMMLSRRHRPEAPRTHRSLLSKNMSREKAVLASLWVFGGERIQKIHRGSKKKIAISGPQLG